jgi:hypothetical protein
MKGDRPGSLFEKPMVRDAMSRIGRDEKEEPTSLPPLLWRTVSREGKNTRIWRLTSDAASSADVLPFPFPAAVRDSNSFKPESPWQA